MDRICTSYGHSGTRRPEDLERNEGISGGKETLRRNTKKNTASPPSDYQIKRAILRGIRKQGFEIDESKHLVPNSTDKSEVRKRHEEAVNFLISRSQSLIRRHEDEYIRRFIANGRDLDPLAIDPKLVEVDNDDKSALFRWVKLHWSVPTSAGYGRRLRYLVLDKQNGKLIGIIGLADPVYGLKDRDAFIGWTKEQRSRRLRNVMDAFVLGSVPPYSRILGGKLVASLVASSEISSRFRRKYRGQTSLISGTVFDGTLAAITTASALGKSAMYDRIRIAGGLEFIHTGWSSGSGDFQFINGNYEKLRDMAKEVAYTGKNTKWGTGVRSRRCVVRKALGELDLSRNLQYHGIRRELFVVPLGENWKEYLCEKTKKFRGYNLPSHRIVDLMMERWVVPRSTRDVSYMSFESDEYRLAKVSS